MNVDNDTARVYVAHRSDGTVADERQKISSKCRQLYVYHVYLRYEVCDGNQHSYIRRKGG
jgi:hypothetical protein